MEVLIVQSVLTVVRVYSCKYNVIHVNLTLRDETSH